VNVKIKTKGKDSKVKMVITRSFGTQNLLELYADYVAKKIKDMLRLERGKKGE
jgi:hypothetical protein